MAYAYGHPHTVRPGATRCVPCVASEAALLVIDVQYYCSVPERGCHADVTREQQPYFFSRVEEVMVPNIAQLLAAARGAGAEPVFTVIEALTLDGRDASLDYKLSGPLLVPKGHPDAAVLRDVAPIGDEIIIPKTSCSVFCSTNVHYVLRNLGTRYLLVCGQLTNQCVESAVRDAADMGYLVTVVEDACAANSAQEHSSALHNMKGFARILSTAEMVAELRAQSKPARIPRGLAARGPRVVSLIKVADDKYYGVRVPEMARELLKDGGAVDFELREYDAMKGELPNVGDDVNGFLMFGSPSSVARGVPRDPWVAPLLCFLQRLCAARRPLAGLCFGHQAVIDALGGAVIVNTAGLQASLKSYEATAACRRALALPEEAKAVSLLYHHNDAAVLLPEGAASWGYGPSGHWGMSIGDWCLTTQAHPEMSLPVGKRALREIFDRERDEGGLDVTTTAGKLSPELHAQYVAALSSPTDHTAVARAFVRLLSLGPAEDGDAGGSGHEPPAKRGRLAAA